MAEVYNCIFRGGVQYTTAETLEVVREGITAKPGTITDKTGAPLAAFTAAPYYIIQEQLHGSVDTASDGAARLLIPKSGQLFAVRCAAGQTIVRDAALEIDAAGVVTVQSGVGVGSTTLFAQDDIVGVTTSGQLIPVRVK
jgi:hypothetical protein